MELLEELQPYVWEIVTSLGMIIAIIKTRNKKSKKEKLERDLERAHEKSQKKEKELKKAYEKETELQKEYDNVTSQQRIP